MTNEATVATTKAQTPAEIGRQKFSSLRTMLEGMKPQFAMALPKHMSVERLMRIALTSVQRTPRLLDCTPKSFLGALMLAAQVGLEPDGVTGRAYLIPRRIQGVWEVCFQTGYQGQVELCQRSGQIKSVNAEVVLEGDFIEEEKGSDAKITHRSGGKWDAPIVGAYAIIKTVGGGEYSSGYWPIGRLLAFKERYVRNEREDSIWLTNPEWAYKKTCIIQASKLAPKSVEQRIAIAAEEMSDAGMSQGAMVGDVQLGDFAESPPEQPQPHPPATNSEKLKTAAKKAKEPEKPAASEPTTPAAASQPESKPAAVPAKEEKPNAQHFKWTDRDDVVKVFLDVTRSSLLEKHELEEILSAHGAVRGHADGKFGLAANVGAQKSLAESLMAAVERVVETGKSN